MKKIGAIFIFILLNHFAFSQEIDQKLLDKACICIGKIPVILDDIEKNDSIRSCITTSNLDYQMTNIVNKIKDSIAAGQMESSNKNEIVVNADQDFETIRKLLLTNCPAMKNVLMANNDKFDNSYSDKKKALELYAKGQDYDEKNQFEKAIAEYKKAVRKDPKFAFAWDNMGMSYRKQGNYKEAIECYKKSLALDPKGTMPLMNMAVAYTFIKDFKSAAETYEKYIEYYPGDPEGYYGAARAHYFNENYEKGVDNILQAYILYKKADSPYIHDAESNISGFYKDLKSKGKLDIFEKAAKKYNVQFNLKQE